MCCVFFTTNIFSPFFWMCKNPSRLWTFWKNSWLSRITRAAYRPVRISCVTTDYVSFSSVIFPVCYEFLHAAFQNSSLRRLTWSLLYVRDGLIWNVFNCRSLNDNNFSGEIPASIGNLKKLYWLDVANNQLSGGIPVSSGNTPGLDLLVNTKHLYVFFIYIKAMTTVFIFSSRWIKTSDFWGTIFSHFGMNRFSGTISPRLFHSKMTLIHV